MRQVFLLDVPPVEEMLKGLHGWLPLLPIREQDCFALHAFIAKTCLGIDVLKVRFVWDLTTSITWPRPKTLKMQDTLSSIMRNHRYIVTDLGRLVTGLELLRCHGYPDSVKLSGPAFDGSGHTELSDLHVRGMAGNTMGVPIVAALQLAVLSRGAPAQASVAVAWWVHGFLHLMFYKSSLILGICRRCLLALGG